MRADIGTCVSVMAITVNVSARGSAARRRESFCRGCEDASLTIRTRLVVLDTATEPTKLSAELGTTMITALVLSTLA